jgi:aryl-alcohol dehydrogenase-like predicted oxidoreductase
VASLGMNRRSRLPENIAALGITLSAEEANEIDCAFADGAIIGDRGPSQVKHLSPER